MMFFCSSAAANADSARLFGQFLDQAAPICQFEPGGVCVELAWQFADGDGDGLLTLDEAREVHAVVQDWSGQAEQDLPPRTRTSVILGLFLVDSAGLDALFAGFDDNNDGYLSKNEFLADVTLDERPLGVTLLDEQAVDRPAIAARFGALAPFLQRLYP